MVELQQTLEVVQNQRNELRQQVGEEGGEGALGRGAWVSPAGWDKYAGCSLLLKDLAGFLWMV